MKIFPTKKQKEIFENFFNTSRYVYNNAIEAIKNGHKPNFQSLRDLLVTKDTKKNHDDYKIRKEEIEQLRETKYTSTSDEEKETLTKLIKEKNDELKAHMKTFTYSRNTNVKEFELSTPKDIRSNAVNQACSAYKSAISNLKNGNIKSFNLGFREKKNKQTIELSASSINLKNGIIRILPTTFGDDCNLKISRRNFKKHKDIVIQNNVDIIKKNKEYFIYIIKPVELKSCENTKTVCGVDPGVRTFATSYSVNENETILRDYTHKVELLKSLNDKLDGLKERKKYYRKKQYSKIEKRKENTINNIHWDVINNLLKHNDTIFYGDIKSHDIVKKGKNKTLNRDLNDLKLYVFKQRLLYKSKTFENPKNVILMNESYTTKTCSSCGTLNNNVGSSKVFSCPSCSLTTGRDENASKNILMKGLFS
jgi:transposase